MATKKAATLEEAEEAGTFNPDLPYMHCDNCGAVFQATNDEIEAQPLADGPDHRWRDALAPRWADHTANCTPKKPLRNDKEATAYVG